MNYTTVTVAYEPPSAGKRGMILVSVRPGLVQDEKVHIALQGFLAAIQRLESVAKSNWPSAVAKDI